METNQELIQPPESLPQLSLEELEEKGKDMLVQSVMELLASPDPKTRTVGEILQVTLEPEAKGKTTISLLKQSPYQKDICRQVIYFLGCGSKEDGQNLAQESISHLSLFESRLNALLQAKTTCGEHLAAAKRPELTDMHKREDIATNLLGGEAILPLLQIDKNFRNRLEMKESAKGEKIPTLNKTELPHDFIDMQNLIKRVFSGDKNIPDSQKIVSLFSEDKTLRGQVKTYLEKVVKFIESHLPYNQKEMRKEDHQVLDYIQDLKVLEASLKYYLEKSLPRPGESSDRSLIGDTLKKVSSLISEILKFTHKQKSNPLPPDLDGEASQIARTIIALVERSFSSTRDEFQILYIIDSYFQITDMSSKKFVKPDTVKQAIEKAIRRFPRLQKYRQEAIRLLEYCLKNSQ